MKKKRQIKPCLAAEGVGASLRFPEPHFNNATDGLRSIKGWGPSTSLEGGMGFGGPDRGPQRGSVILYYDTFKKITIMKWSLFFYGCFLGQIVNFVFFNEMSAF